MAEVKKFWVCWDPQKIDGSYAHYWEDPAIQDDEHRIMQIGPSPEGMTIHGLVRVYMGTNQSRWERENTKVYDDYASAKADGEKRLAKAKKLYEKQKQASADPLIAKVATRFARIG